MVGSEFDVFLSFRGEDTRNGFTDHLYEGLQLHCVNTFRDSEGLKKGEEIKKLLGYIEKSKICIPIFSKGYADSKWCLRELAKVVECKKKVIPVFFEVDPSHVKDQSHSFAYGFKKHESEGEVKQEELIKWRDALREVGNISGFTLNDTNWKEGKLVQIIVKRILQELNPHHLDVGEYIVGHESLLEELESTLDMKSNDVRMIGIHGMGGIGKTTLVKALYNKIFSKFEAYSFLFNVRETSLVSLQQQLLKDIFQSDETFTHESKGTQLIKEKIGNKKVLIILDDVDSRDQLKALVSSRDWLKKGSRIIITTRDTKPLIKHGVKGDEVYELQGLNYDDSMKLFCYHAFGNEKPSISNEYADMCDEAVSFIKGLPLALEVLGSQFFDLKTEKEWRGWLARLKDCQDEEIFEKLKLSYDSLQDSEKKVFLDIACFFVGTRISLDGWWDIPFEVDDVKHFWEECGFYPGPAINVLKHKSLIKIHEWKGDDEYQSLDEIFGRHFEMHDQIRDMGRKIVEDEEKEGKSCSRLWNIPKVIQTLQKQRVQTTTTIEGIMFKGEEEASDFSSPCLQEMDRLRLFHVCGAKVECSLHFPKNLKWLGLPNCQHLTSPSVSIPADVRVLDLHGNDNVAEVLVEKCRSTSTVINVFKKLKILDLTQTEITITPDFSCIPSLLKLTLKYCRELVEVHESVGKLKSLVWLNFEGCKKLEELPDTISELSSLEFFSLNGCSDLLYLPKQLGNMTSLKNLDLRTDSKHIKSLSSSIEKLDHLEHLHMNYYIGAGTGDLVAESELSLKSAYFVDALPNPCCRSKTHLRLDDITIKELMDSFIRWENLESLILDCMSLKSVPASVGQLQKLKVLEVYSDKLILADDALPLKSIEKLVLQCHVFKHLPPFSKKAQNLKHLALICKEMEVLPDWIGSSSELERLELSSCLNTSRIPLVFEKLKFLKLDHCQMTVTPNFSSLPCLERLMLTNCKALIEVHESIGSLNKLEFLEIIKCTRLERLPDKICELHYLKSLDLNGCVNLSSLPEQLAHHMELLEELCLDETGIQSLPAASMGKFTRLQHLSVRNCNSLNTINESFISCLESLKQLHIQGIPLKGMPTDIFSVSTSDKTLDASTPWEFMDALPISFCESIHKLCFTNERIEKLTDSIGRFGNVLSMTLKCKMLKALPNSIGQLKNLNDLYLKCNTVALFDWIYLPESLERLKVQCIEFGPQPFSSTILENSTAYGCKNVKGDPPIIGQLGCLSQDQSNKNTVMLKKLGTLDLCAKQITVTPDFSFAPYLEELTLRNCEMLIEVHESVGTLVNLKSLKITGCNALEGLPEAICHLTSLKSLELRQYVFGRSEGGEHIRLENPRLRDTRIKSILSSLEQFTKLEEVCISRDLDGTNFRKIKFKMSTLETSVLCLEWVTALWSSVLHSVKTLVIIDEQIEALPDCIAQMQNLECLEFACGSLKAVPNWIGQLKRLHTFQPMSDYGSFTTQRDCLASLGGLQKLSLRGCQNIKHLPNTVRQMERLKCLDLSETGILKLPPWLGCLTNLTHLNLSTPHQNDVKTGIVKLPPWLGCLTNLTHLNLSTTRQNDVVLSGLSHLTSLVELDLSGRNFGSSLSCISNFSRLEVLNVSGCKQLRSIPHLSSSVLRELDASNCTNLRELPDFSNLEHLGCLLLGGCNSIECIPGFKTIAENIYMLELPGPSGACSNLSDDFRNNVFMGARFRYLCKFKMEGNIIAGSHSGQQCLFFLFPDVRFNTLKKCSSLKLSLRTVSSPVDIKVITKDDLVLFETTLKENDFDDGYKTFSSFEEGDREILEHLSKGSGTIQVSTDASQLYRVELKAEFGEYWF